MTSENYFTVKISILDSKLYFSLLLEVGCPLCGTETLLSSILELVTIAPRVYSLR